MHKSLFVKNLFSVTVGFAFVLFFAVFIFDLPVVSASQRDLTIIKNTVGGDGTFFFTTTGGSPLSDFSIATSGGTGNKPFSNLQNGQSYTVTETVPAGWSLTGLTCPGQTVDLTRAQATVSLSRNNAATCTFTNTKRAHIIVVKDAITNDAQDFTFQNNFSNGNPATFQLDDDSGAPGANGTLSNTRDFEVLPGTAYSVSEDPTAGWKQTSQTCTGNGNTSGNITVGAGETITCTFVNKKFAQIILIKNTVGGDGTFDFVMTGNTLPSSVQLTTSAGTVQQIFNNIDSDNTYSITETPMPAGWDVTGAICTGTNTPAIITPNNGEIVTCTFTNTKRAFLSIVKISNSVDPDSNSFSFRFDLTGPAQADILASHIFTPSGIWNLGNLFPNLYSLSETILSPLVPLWTGSQAIACDGNGTNDPSGTVASPFEFTLNPGDDMRCTVNNTQDALITGKKFEDTDADGIVGNDAGLSGWKIIATLQDNPATQDVVESGGSEATTDNGGNYTLQVQPGTYQICETLQSGWTQSYPTTSIANAISCGDDYGYELIVVAGDNKNGNDFGNYRKGLIAGMKFEDINGNGVRDDNEMSLEGWTINLFDGAATMTTETDEDGLYEFTGLAPGTYRINESQQSGWIKTTADPAAVTMQSGKDVKDIDFGNFKLATVTGFKWDDKNGDGIWQKSCEGQNENEGCVAEPGKQGISMALGRQNGDSKQENGHETIPIEIIAMTLTGNDGGFTIHNVAPGHYKLFEEKKSGWQATNPASHADSFFDISYDRTSIAIGDPDFDLLRIGDPDFDLLRSSFFDIFVELSGQNVNQNEATKGLITTIPGVPLEFGNHKLLVLSQEAATKVKETSTVITWTTDFPGTSRVVYDMISHPVLVGSAPNYEYANSTAVFDESPKVTNHSVSVSGLATGTTYYYRTISAASPESVSGEGSFGTSAPSSGGGNGGGGGGDSTGIIIQNTGGSGRGGGNFSSGASGGSPITQTIISPVAVALNTGTENANTGGGSSETNQQLPAGTAKNEQEPKSEAGVGTGNNASQQATVSEPTAGQSDQQNTSFLAAIGSGSTLGAGSIVIGLIVLLALFCGGAFLVRKKWFM